MNKFIYFIVFVMFVFQVNANEIQFKKMDEIQNIIPKYIGPNCFNSTLFITGLNKHIRFTEDAEFTAYMNSPYCRKLNPDENRKKGDIMAIRMPFNDGSTMEKHAQLIVDDMFSLSKNNSQLSSTYKIQSNEYLYSITEVTEDKCKTNNGTQHIECNMATDIYRCDSENVKLTDTQQTKNDLIEQIETIVAEKLVNKIFLTEQHFIKIDSILTQYFNLEKNDFVDNLNLKKLESISIQFELLGLGNDKDKEFSTKISSLIRHYL